MSYDFTHLKLKLAYPCLWTYKVIGAGEEILRLAIAESLPEQDYTVTLSNESRTGKYCCLNVQITVDNDEERTHMYDALRRHPLIRMIL